MIESILCVCLGNICRSPTAEGVLRVLSDRAGLDLCHDSAGTGGWHIGDPPYGPAIRAAAARGYDIAAQRARRITAADFGRFDLILAMDRANLAAVNALRPAGMQTPVRLLLDYADTPLIDVPDPYFTDDFEGALDLIEAGARGVLSRLADQPQ
ncbi:MAG: low molecular weight phosphotyrosine protein phosphatase [Rhodobacter sp.]|nr:low molecular weight phosphotyrosine protein phosphatase [Rhodobacter sp.]